MSAATGTRLRSVYPRLRYWLAAVVFGTVVLASLLTPLKLPVAGVFLSAAIVMACALLPIRLPPVDLHLGHAVGLGVLFVYGPRSAAWSLAVGLVVAELVRDSWGAVPRPFWPTLADEINTQLLPLLAAAGVYAGLGGVIPTVSMRPELWGAIAGFAIIYYALFNLFLSLCANVPDRLLAGDFSRGDLLQLFLLEILPLPITLFAAGSYQSQGPNLAATLGGSLLLLAAALNRLGRVQVRLHEQAEENRRLYTQAEARLQQETILYEIGSALSSTLDRRAIFATVTERLAHIGRAAESALLDFDDSSGRLRTVYQWSPPPSQPRVPARGYSADAYPDFIELLRSGSSRLTRIDDPATQADDRAQLAGWGFTARLALPLTTSEQVIGVAELYYATPAGPDEADMRLARTLANQAAIALSNARLFYRMRESRDRLLAVLNSTREGVLVVDASGQISLVNPPLEAFWELPAGRLVGRNLLELLDQPDLHVAAKLGFERDEVLELLQTLKAGLALTIPKSQFVLHQPRWRVLERTGNPILDQFARAIGWVIVLRDVTEERATQDMREALSSMIVHDLRSPLMGITASLALLKDQITASLAQAPIASQALQVAHRSSQRLMTLVNTLLDISRLESGQISLERAPVSLDALSAEIISEYLPLAREYGVFLLNQVPVGLPAVPADRDKLSRVLVNLLDNALKFTPEGGRVEVAAEMLPAAADGLRRIQCAVLDTGRGVPPESLSVIFDRFAQVNPSGGRRPGTGLGLAFCKLAVEAHGGQIWAENRPEGGTAVRFTLPLEPV